MDEYETLKKQIAELPIGYITTRKVSGKTYFYHQGTENGKPFSRTIAEADVPAMQEKIDRRKTLIKQLKALPPAKIPSGTSSDSIDTETESDENARFYTNVTFADALTDFIRPAVDFQKRDCYGIVSAFVNGKREDKVCAVYGLRRTGKTTLLKQLLLDLSEEQFSHAAYIKTTTTDTIVNLNKYIVTLWDAGYRYLFID